MLVLTGCRRNEVRKYRTHPRERFLTGEEYCRLGRAIDELEAKRTVSRHAAAAIRLLVLTGCRRNEVLELRWDDIDRTAGELRLREGKTGARMVPLTLAVQGVLAEFPRVPNNPWVIAGQKPGARMTNVNDPWLVVRARAGLDDVRIHDLRHSWASRALALGESLSMIGKLLGHNRIETSESQPRGFFNNPMIGKLLGHNRIETTARYAHLARDTEKASAAKIGGSIGADILPIEDAEAASWRN